MSKSRPFPFGELNTIYENPWTRFVERKFDLPSGKQGVYAYMEKPAGAVVLPIDVERRRVTLIHQYRLPIDDWTYEAPMGGVEPGEDYASAAARELEEEAGLIPRILHSLGEVYPAPGLTPLKVGLFLALDCVPGHIARDESERMEVEELDLDQALDWIDAGKIDQTLTIMLLLRAARYLDQQKEN